MMPPPFRIPYAVKPYYVEPVLTHNTYCKRIVVHLLWSVPSPPLIWSLHAKHSEWEKKLGPNPNNEFGNSFRLPQHFKKVNSNPKMDSPG